jgi:HPt (histidine-containing phosphotransfer) domain-containing protein
MYDTNGVLNQDRLAALRELCDGETSLVAEIAEIYLEEIPGRVESLADTAAAKAYDVTRDVAHLIKGASANIGADDMAALCLSLEEAAVARAPERIEALIDRMNAYLPRVCEALACELGQV